MDTIRFTADKHLESDLTKANSYEDVRSLLENASVRSGIGHRDPSTGRFVAVETDSQRAAAPAVPEAEKHVMKDVEISGQQFTFEGTALEVETAIRQAYEVAEALRPAESSLPVVPRDARNTAYDHPITEYLAEKGFDVDRAANQQSEADWAAATQEFLGGVGGDWPGGQKNMELIGMKIIELGLENTPDKVAALAQAYESMREQGLIFQSDYTPEQAVMDTKDATPQAILEAWKSAQSDGDPDQANEAFIQAFRNGRSSGIFGR